MIAFIRPRRDLVVKHSVLYGEGLMGPASPKKSVGSPELLGGKESLPSVIQQLMNARVPVDDVTSTVKLKALAKPTKKNKKTRKK